MNNVVAIIERFGGVRPLARTLGLSPMAVQNWKRTGFVPARRQQAVIEAGRKIGVEVAPKDFFEPISE